MNGLVDRRRHRLDPVGQGLAVDRSGGGELHAAEPVLPPRGDRPPRLALLHLELDAATRPDRPERGDDGGPCRRRAGDGATRLDDLRQCLEPDPLVAGGAHRDAGGHLVGAVELAATAGAASDADQAGTQASRSAGSSRAPTVREEQETAGRRQDVGLTWVTFAVSSATSEPVAAVGRVASGTRWRSGLLWESRVAGSGGRGASGPQRGSLPGQRGDAVPVAGGERVGRGQPRAADAADVGQGEVRRGAGGGDATGRAEPGRRAAARPATSGTPPRRRPRRGRTSSPRSPPRARPSPRRPWRCREGTAPRTRPSPAAAPASCRERRGTAPRPSRRARRARAR